MNAKRARRRAAGTHADAEAGDDQRNPRRWCEYAFEQYKGEPAEQRADGARHPRKESAAEAKRNPVKRVRAEEAQRRTFFRSHLYIAQRIYQTSFKTSLARHADADSASSTARRHNAASEVLKEG